MSTAPLSHSKICNIEDFAHPELERVLREVFAHELKRFGPEFPRGREYRKDWEVAMSVRAMQAAGVLHETSEVLGVGAGTEPTIFWLTTRAKRVFATDLYLAGGDWQGSASHAMLMDPGIYWPGVWNPRRLVVQHMNGLDLLFEDESFDAVFSSGSIEHFGGVEDVEQAMREMFRVLKPGGLLTLSTEYRISGPSPGLPGVLMFDLGEIDSVLIGDLSWELISPLDPTVSPSTLQTVHAFQLADNELRMHVDVHGSLFFHKLEWSHYPHVVLQHDGLTWTSVHLALRKSTA